MRILSIDPGHTTGIAVYSKEGELDFSLAVNAEALMGKDFILGIIYLSKPEIVLLEGLPSRVVDEKTQEVFSYIRRSFVLAGYPVEIIYPSQWKNLVKRVEIPGQHARDAATMARWWIESEKGHA